MTSISFRVRGKSKRVPVIARFNHKGLSSEVRLTLFINPTHWDSKKQRLSSKANFETRNLINQKLQDFESGFWSHFNFERSQQIPVTENTLKEFVVSFFGNDDKDNLWKVYFTDFIEKKWKPRNENGKRLHNGKPCSATTVNLLLDAARLVQEFDKWRGEKTKFSDFDLDWKNKFEHYVINLWEYSSKVGHERLSSIQTILREAKTDYKYPFKINDFFESRKFQIPKDDDDNFKRPVLNFDQIKKLYRFKVHTEGLEIVRDLFVIGCLTSLRISDLLELQKSGKITHDWIKIKPRKTKKHNIEVDIPNNPLIREILKKYNQEGKRLSVTKPNVLIKQLFKLAGYNDLMDGVISKLKYIKYFDVEKKRSVVGKYPIHELIQMHDSRRTCATVLFLNGIPKDDIMALTGHTKEEMLDTYIQVDQYNKDLSKVKSLYSKQFSEFEPKMKKVN